MNIFWHTAVEVHKKLSAKDIPYCIIKSYGGDLDYADGNIDVVTTLHLMQTYSEVFADDFLIFGRDRFKNMVYERNKLMLTPRGESLCKIHLHSNVGWHNYCFIDGKYVLENAREKPIESNVVRVLNRDLEARAFVLHVIFEQFKKNPWDLKFLTWSDYESFAQDYSIDIELLRVVHEAQSEIQIEQLRPIWKQYYSRCRGDVGLWNRFLHELLVYVQSRRRSQNLRHPDTVS